MQFMQMCTLECRSDGCMDGLEFLFDRMEVCVWRWDVLAEHPRTELEKPLQSAAGSFSVVGDFANDFKALGLQTKPCIR
ncbi:hypothetical protein KC19_VG017800 [Ceratodon purpureus]|uniref:Uncharacterized protein n=1 Tax=Ceratodon purpureus TaxID=3225 RepID=A0A8T0HL41_CERPU|nr:hypothetical protein KC19_VG017800 [Ceratodon purpureus]